MSRTKSCRDTKDQRQIMDAAEHRAAPLLNEILSKEEKEKILLPGVLTEGHAAIDAVLQFGISIIERRDGVLECVDRAFNRAVSEDGGRTWCKHALMDDLNQRHKKAAVDDNNVLSFGWIRLPSGRIGMGWSDSGRGDRGHKYNKQWWRISDDEGKSWSKDVLINPTGELGTPCHLEQVRLTSTGRILMPVCLCFNGGPRMYETYSGAHGTGWWKGENVHIEGHNHWPELQITYVYYSDDEGKTWYRSEGEVFGWPYKGWGNVVSCDEPAIEELKDGRLILLMRSTIGRLLQSTSEDGGEHWSIVEPCPLASSNSPCALKKIPKTGDLLCVWNQVTPDEIRQGKQRGRLSAAITSDGETWKHFRTIERHGRMNEADRVEPDEILLMCRSLDDVGDISPDWGGSDYATIAFHGDDVIITYPQIKRPGKDLVSAMKITVLPLDWFYAAP